MASHVLWKLIPGDSRDVVIELGREGLLGQPWTNGTRHLHDGRSLVDFLFAAVGQ